MNTCPSEKAEMVQAIGTLKGNLNRLFLNHLSLNWTSPRPILADDEDASGVLLDVEDFLHSVGTTEKL